MPKAYNFEFYNNKPSGGNFNLYGDITQSNNVFTSGTDEWMSKAFTMTGGTSYSKLLLINLYDFMKMKSLQDGETMYDIRFTPISYLQYIQLMDVNFKVMEMPVASETELVNLLKKYAPVYTGCTAMGMEDILNLYTKPYGFKCVEKSSLSDDCNGMITKLIGKNLFGNATDIGSDAVKKTGMFGLNLEITDFSDYTFYEYRENVTHRNSYTKFGLK